ncbi:MAG TPA: acyltransferase domain-containing protein, partial [Urbifossiella sp.]
GGVNSFGFGGTNAHAVLSSAPQMEGCCKASSASPEIWTVSARSPAALVEAAKRDAEWLTHAKNFAELAATVRSRRSHHSHRVAVVADDAASAAEKLMAFSAGSSPAGLFVGQAPLQPPPVAIVFSGQGTQWPGMARDLFQINPRFRATCEELDAIMRPAWGRSLIEEILRGDETVYQSDIGQPVLFALQIGVYRLYIDEGITPAMVFGHSFGEVAAAHACGALTLADAAKVIVERAKALELTNGAGVMAAVGISEAEAQVYLKRFPNWLSIAAFNSDNDLTLAGDEASVRAVVDDATKQGRFARSLPFPYAFHSQAVEGCRDVFTRAIEGLPAKPPEIPFVSTVIARELVNEIPDDKYWWRNLRQPVRFADATRRAVELGAKVFLEVGPHPGLVRYVKQVVGAAPEFTVLGSLKRNESGPQCITESLATLHVAGVRIHWKKPVLSRHVSVPKYPWQRQQFWAESEDSRQRRLAPPTHPLLGNREPAPAKQWEACLSSDQFPYLADHGFRGRAVFPAAGHIELMLAAAAEGSFADPIGLADVNFERILWADQPHEVRTSFDANSRRLTVSARAVGDAGRGWELCSRSVRWAADASGHSPERSLARPAGIQTVSVEELYARFERGGNHYGPQFRTVRNIGKANGELWADVSLDPAHQSEASHYYLHPALLDGVFQTVLAATPVDEERESMFLPVRIERIEWRRRAGASVACRIRNVHIQDVRWFADIDVFTPEGEWIATLAGCCCVKKPQEA